MLMSFDGENSYHDKVDTKYAQDEITTWVYREINSCLFSFQNT